MTLQCIPLFRLELLNLVSRLEGGERCFRLEMERLHTRTFGLQPRRFNRLYRQLMEEARIPQKHKWRGIRAALLDVGVPLSEIERLEGIRIRTSRASHTTRALKIPGAPDRREALRNDIGLWDGIPLPIASSEVYLEERIQSAFDEASRDDDGKVHCALLYGAWLIKAGPRAHFGREIIFRNLSWIIASNRPEAQVARFILARLHLQKTVTNPARARYTQALAAAYYNKIPLEPTENFTEPVLLSGAVNDLDTSFLRNTYLDGHAQAIRIKRPERILGTSTMAFASHAKFRHDASMTLVAECVTRLSQSESPLLRINGLLLEVTREALLRKPARHGDFELTDRIHSAMKEADALFRGGLISRRKHAEWRAAMNAALVLAGEPDAERQAAFEQMRRACVDYLCEFVPSRDRGLPDFLVNDPIYRKVVIDLSGPESFDPFFAQISADATKQRSLAM